MTLESQCISLEIARRLKELNVPQRSLFYWSRSGEHFCQTDKVEAGEASIVSEKPPYDFPFECLGSAFTVAELGEMLPEGHYSYRRGSSWFNGGDMGKINIGVAMHSEANARGKMLIHLIEAGILNVKEL